MTARAWIGTAATNAAILGSGLITGILAARLLGPDDRGLLALILFWPQLLATLGFCSLGEAIVRRGNTSSADRGRLLATALALSVGLAALTMIIGWAALPWLLGGSRADAVSLSTQFLMAFVPLNFVALALLGFDHADLRFDAYNMLRLVPTVVYLVALLGLWAMNAFSVSTLVWATWAATGITAVVRLARVPWASVTLPSAAEARALLTVAVSFHATAVLATVAAQIDRIVVMRSFDDATVGHYAVALVCAMTALGLVTNTVHTVLFPQVAREAERNRQIGMIVVGMRRSVIVLLLGTLALLLPLPWAIPLVFGEAFRDAIEPALVLTLAYAPLALRQILARCLRGIGDARGGTVAELTAIVATLAIAWPLIAPLGLIGVAAGLLAGNTLALIWLAFDASRRHGMNARAWLLPTPLGLRDVLGAVSRIARERFA
jgi:O-antigen/teichoic acid export membrane protein